MSADKPTSMFVSDLLDIAVSSPLWTPEAPWRALVARARDACAQDEGDDWPDREISVLLSDDAEMRALNAQWRKIDKATNVLSFPGPDHAHAPLGDIAISFSTARREADDEGKAMEAHVTHLVVHGVLHLLGFDHETGDDDAEAMEEAERRILAALGIADPYPADREPVRRKA